MEDKSNSKDSFMLKKNYFNLFKDLEDNQKSKLLDAIFIFEIEKKEIIIEDKVLKPIIRFILEDLKLNNKKYNIACKRKEESAKSRWSKSKKETSKEVKILNKKDTEVESNVDRAKRIEQEAKNGMD